MCTERRGLCRKMCTERRGLCRKISRCQWIKIIYLVFA
jgi:hypothetical protein